MKLHKISYAHLLLQLLLYDVFLTVLLVPPYLFWADTWRSLITDWLKLIPLWLPAYIQIFSIFIAMIILFINYRWSQCYFNVCCGYGKILLCGATIFAVIFTILVLFSLLLRAQNTPLLFTIFAMPGTTIYLAALSLYSGSLSYNPLGAASIGLCLLLAALSAFSLIVPLCVSTLFPVKMRRP